MEFVARGRKLKDGSGREEDDRMEARRRRPYDETFQGPAFFLCARCFAMLNRKYLPSRMHGGHGGGKDRALGKEGGNGNQHLMVQSI